MPDGSTPHGRRPRPVAGLPAPDPVAVAKAWLLELLAHTPLPDAGCVPVDLLAREAPALCAAIREAVADDAALDRLQDGDRVALAARTGALCGAATAADVVAAVEALRTVLHRALRTSEDAALAADTGDRLAHVCAQVAIAALAGVGEAASLPGAPSAPAPAPLAPPEEPGTAVTAQDQRPALTGGHLDALRGALGDGGPVSVLAIELDGLERLSAVEGAPELAAALVPLERALAGAAPQAVLVREQPGRWWLIAAGVGGAAGRALAQGLADVVAAQAPVRHAVPLTASIGVASAPDDGTDALALVEHADQGVFTARALGVPVA